MVGRAVLNGLMAAEEEDDDEGPAEVVVWPNADVDDGDDPKLYMFAVEVDSVCSCAAEDDSRGRLVVALLLEVLVLLLLLLDVLLSLLFEKRSDMVLCFCR